METGFSLPHISRQTKTLKTRRKPRSRPDPRTRKLSSVGHERPGSVFDRGSSTRFAGPLEYPSFDEIPEDHRCPWCTDSEQVPDDPVGDPTVLADMLHHRPLDLTAGVTPMLDGGAEPAGGVFRQAVADPVTTCRRLDRLDERRGGFRYPFQGAGGFGRPAGPSLASSRST